VTAYTGTIPTLTSGQVPDGNDWLEILNALKALTEPWSTYTSTWGSSGSAPALGNGTIFGAYQQLRKLLVLNIGLSIGSTSTVGSGNYTFTLPGAGALTWATGSPRNMCSVGIRDQSAANHYTAFALLTPGASVIDTIRFHGGNVVGAASPFVPAAGDFYSILAIGELA
jgi:hypothetical protein